MGYDNSKGLISLPVGYSGGSYQWKKLSYKYAQPSGINITPNQMQDIDSYVNGNGKLKRTVLQHSRTKMEWSTPYLTYEDKVKLLALINNAFKYGSGIADQRKCHVRYYNDLKDDYETGDFYIPDIQFSYHSIYAGKPLYLPIRIAFIEY